MSLQAQQMAFNKQVVHQMRKQQIENEMIRPTQPLQFRHPLMGEILLPGNSPAYSDMTMYPSGAGLERMIGGRKPNKALKFFEGASKAVLPLALGAVGTYLGGPMGGLGGVALGRAVGDELPQGGKMSKAGKASERVLMKLGKVGESLAEKVASKMFDSGVKYATSDSPAPASGGKRTKGATDKKKRDVSAWVTHVKEYRKLHPGLSYKEALSKAGETYKGKGKGKKELLGKVKKEKEKKIISPGKEKTKEMPKVMEGGAVKFAKVPPQLKPWMRVLSAVHTAERRKNKDIPHKEIVKIAKEEYALLKKSKK